ncbi:helix-turn-helix domain-containing protein [Burkholderia diffusa]|uniref:helix-turn-helix domain-containing protein n=1 Tax=Burkholderia diffusa TaxID=488732 RepID=UPI00075A02E9|nr:helix-turn-helix transcriptional regulator [Burkholderia diffusa]KVG33839.1 hypothetical protein WJ30_07140 [Burkholderia diffusa]
MPAKPLTPEQLNDAARLRSLFKQWQQEQKDLRRPASQMEAAAQLGFGQSALSQYLRGEIPLNVRVAMKFAKLLGKKVDDFSPTLATELLMLASALDFDLVGNDSHHTPFRDSVAETTKTGKTEEKVNPSIHPDPKRVHNDRLQIAQRFSRELLDAVTEGRVTDELLNTLMTVFTMGVAAAEAGPHGDQHHTKMVSARGSRKRGTGT